MRRSTEDLSNRRLPIKTQEEIIDKLDRMIQEMETPQPKNQGNSGDPQPDRAAPDSFPDNTSGKGSIDNKILESIAKQWGTMPEKEREAVKQEMIRSVPDKYKSLVEQYLKSLNR
jgi:hypothetical protein